jgi:hypothetical protein
MAVRTICHFLAKPRIGRDQRRACAQMMCTKMDAGYKYAQDPDRVLSVEDAVRR